MERMKAQGSVEPDVVTFNALISACEKGGQPRPALVLLRQMWVQAIAPDEKTYTAVIGACRRGRETGKGDSLQELLEEVQRQALLPTKKEE